MAHRTSIFAVLTLCAGFAACTTETDSAADLGPSAGGKADETVDCAPNEELRIELVGIDADTASDGDKLQNSVTATCFNDTGFEDAACCEQAGLFDAYAAATSCPQRAVVTKPEGNPELSRCQDATTGQFVASACCANDLCSADAAWLTTKDGDLECRANGKFEDTICCFNNAALASNSCEGAAWETLTIRGQERDVCRGESGAFALNSCCAAECVAAVSEESLGFGNVPEACEAKVTLTSPTSECPADAHPNSAGLCHNPVNGQFVLAACCEAVGDITTDRSDRGDRAPDLDRGRSDLCFEGREIAGCLRDEFVCSFNSPTRLAETTSDLSDKNSRRFTADDLEDAGITDRDREQVVAAVQHLGFDAAGSDFKVVFEAADGGEFFLISDDVDGKAINWIQFFAGDNEVGVMFDAGTLDIVGEVSDGDILGCGRPVEAACPGEVEEAVTECMQTWMDDTGEGFFAAIDFCDGEIRFGDDFTDRLCEGSNRDECRDERLAQANNCLGELAARGDF